MPRPLGLIYTQTNSLSYTLGLIAPTSRTTIRAAVYLGPAPVANGPVARSQPGQTWGQHSSIAYSHEEADFFMNQQPNCSSTSRA